MLSQVFCVFLWNVPTLKCLFIVINLMFLQIKCYKCKENIGKLERKYIRLYIFCTHSFFIHIFSLFFKKSQIYCLIYTVKFYLRYSNKCSSADASVRASELSESRRPSGTPQEKNEAPPPSPFPSPRPFPVSPLLRVRWYYLPGEGFCAQHPLKSARQSAFGSICLCGCGSHSLKPEKEKSSILVFTINP